MKLANYARTAVLCALLPAGHVMSAPLQTEVDHLLLYVEKSECTFVRNGSTHNGAQAAAHLREKYRHARGRIRTTEQFIKYVAAGSSVSGKPYLIRCEGKKPVSSAKWLSTELVRFRKGDSRSR
jgi:hypothetical protein